MFSSFSSRFIIRSQSGLYVYILSITIFCWTLSHTFPHCKPKVSVGQQGRGLQSPASSWRPSLWASLQRGFFGQKPARSVSFCCFKKYKYIYIYEYIWDFEDCWSGLNMFEWFSLFTVVSKPRVLCTVKRVMSGFNPCIMNQSADHHTTRVSPSLRRTWTQNISKSWKFTLPSGYLFNIAMENHHF
jgi:hypothetical protein